MAFMTTADVEALLPGTATEDNLKTAIFVIELYTGISLDGSYTFIESDEKCLKMAVAAMTMWLPSQFNYLARVAATNYSADGAGFGFSQENQALLAPLAKRALRNLSYRNSSYKPLSDSERANYYANYFLVNDPYSDQNWQPLI